MAFQSKRFDFPILCNLEKTSLDYGKMLDAEFQIVLQRVQALAVLAGDYAIMAIVACYTMPHALFVILKQGPSRRDNTDGVMCFEGVTFCRLPLLNQTESLASLHKAFHEEMARLLFKWKSCLFCFPGRIISAILKLALRRRIISGCPGKVRRGYVAI